MRHTRLGLSLAALFMSALAAAATRGELANSPWIASQRLEADKTLGSTAADLLVVPVQCDKEGFDPIERSLITRLVSDRLVRTAGILVPNPTVVFREFGAFRSVYPQEDIDDLANSVHATQALELHACHGQNGRFEFSAILRQEPGSSVLRSKTWQDLKFDDETPPSLAIDDVLDELVEFISGAKPSTPNPAGKARIDDFRFPQSIEELKTESAKSPLHAAAYLQLVGMLHPNGWVDEARNDLFERSLVLLRELPHDAPDKRYFEARALAYLGRRPAAVHVLADPRTVQERALLAAINGNITLLRQLVEQMGTSPMEFMAWRDLLLVEQAYSEHPERQIVEQFVTDHPVWAPFLYRALRDTNNWADFSAMTVKLGLENLLPNDATTLEAFINSGAARSERPDELELTRLVERHVDAFEDATIAAWTNDPKNYLAVSELDIIDLAQSLVVINQWRRVEDDLAIRATPEAALRKIAEFEPLFAGHPAITLQKSRAMDELAQRSSGAERNNLVINGAKAALDGLAWTGQMTPDAAWAARNYGLFRMRSRIGMPVEKEHAPESSQKPVRYDEWPRGSWWFAKIPGSEEQFGIIQTCVDYSWTAFYCLKGLIEHPDPRKPAEAQTAEVLLAKYADRYVGSLERTRFELQVARKHGGGDSEIERLRAQIENGTADWPIYYALGRALKRRGDFQDAQEVFLSFPGFSDTRHEQALSNGYHAYDAGSMFYWIGQYELAAPLLEMAAANGAGSEGSLSAGYRLALIEGDLDNAQDWAAARARRYQSKYAIRDLQEILHLRGESELAWSIFAQVQPMYDEPPIWSGPLVGHRMASASVDDIADWIAASQPRSNATMFVGRGLGVFKMSARYLLLTGTMDRAPGSELLTAMSRFRSQLRPMYFPYGQPNSFKPELRPVSRSFVADGGQILEHDALVPMPMDDAEKPEKPQPGKHVQIDTRYELLAQAMSAFLSGDHQRAFELFDETAHYYYLDEYLPYYAFSASVVHHAGHLSRALAAREPSLEEIARKESLDHSELGYRFDEDLTYAVLASFEGKHEEALGYLERAMNNRPYVEARTLYPYYEVVDLADRLYERTKVTSYRSYALDLARRHTVVLPMYGWAYFVVAKFSESPDERIRAAASGLKLDPLSYRGSKLPSELVRQAKAYLSENDAPYLHRSSAGANLGT